MMINDLHGQRKLHFKCCRIRMAPLKSSFSRVRSHAPGANLMGRSARDDGDGGGEPKRGEAFSTGKEL